MKEMRLDKFLFFARFFKSRKLAIEFIQRGHLRINRLPTDKAHSAVRIGDVLTFPWHHHQVMVIEVVSLPIRRGPAVEAQNCYAKLVEGP